MYTKAHLNLKGRLMADPKVRVIRGKEKDITIGDFIVAVDNPRLKKDEQGPPMRYKVIVFGQQALNCEKHLRKGQLVDVTGQEQGINTWQTKDGDLVCEIEVKPFDTPESLIFGPPVTVREQPEPQKAPEEVPTFDDDDWG